MLIDKPAGPTSHDVVQRVRRAAGTRAVGHTGTLDPFATGLLVVLVGRATRLARFVESDRKTYQADVRLGVRTDTEDATGAVVDEWHGPWPTRPDVVAALQRFTGAQQQRPPAYSAKHVAGERSYQLARRGIEVELPEVPVTVHELELLAYEPPVMQVRVTVSAGTYLRALGRDVGDALGTGAHVVALRRERIGALDVTQAMPLASVTRGVALLPPEAVLPQWPRIALDPEQRQAVRHGRSIQRGDLVAPHALLMDQDELLAVAEVREDGLHPVVVLAAA